MSAIGPGVQVICVRGGAGPDGAWVSEDGGEFNRRGPRVGSVYTVLLVLPHPDPEYGDGLVFHECGPFDAYPAANFRPIRDDAIDCFRALLKVAPADLEVVS